MQLFPEGEIVMKETELITKAFAEKFGSTEGVRLFFAPGRVNLIGEHTDYNGGHVFPCAISLGTYAAARKRNDRIVRLYSANFPNAGVTETSLDELVPLEKAGWAGYPKGVIWAFDQRGYTVENGFDMVKKAAESLP